jgi:hypothetical protein
VPDRRGSRFLLEVLFLAGLAAALAYARLRTAEIAGVMLAGWALVAALEWVAWRGRPHYRSGLPPRYYVPRLNLPSLPPGFPIAVRHEEQTWIASPAMRTEVLGDWPLAAPGSAAARATPPEADPWLVASLPVAPIEPGTAGRMPEPGFVPTRPASEVEPEVAVVTWSTVRAARAREGPTAFHSLDPLAEEPRRRRRGDEEEPLRVAVPARPPGVRRLPSRWKAG